MSGIKMIKKQEDTIHLSCRNDEYRMVIKSERENEMTLIARFSIEDVDFVKQSELNMVTIQHELYEIQHSLPIAYTTFYKEKREIMCEVKGVSIRFQFDEEEWLMLLSFNW